MKRKRDSAESDASDRPSKRRSESVAGRVQEDYGLVISKGTLVAVSPSDGQPLKPRVLTPAPTTDEGMRKTPLYGAICGAMSAEGQVWSQSLADQGETKTPGAAVAKLNLGMGRLCAAVMEPDKEPATAAAFAASTNANHEAVLDYGAQAAHDLAKRIRALIARESSERSEQKAKKSLVGALGKASDGKEESKDSVIAKLRAVVAAQERRIRELTNKQEPASV